MDGDFDDFLGHGKIDHRAMSLPQQHSKPDGFRL
jgi:hypothetical protein